MDNQEILKDLDQEWVELIQDARDLGLSMDEIREFLGQTCVTD